MSMVIFLMFGLVYVLMATTSKRRRYHNTRN